MVDGLHGEAGAHALWRVARELKHEVARAHLQVPREVAPPVPGPQHPVKHVRIWSAFVRVIYFYLFKIKHQKHQNLKHHHYQMASVYFLKGVCVCVCMCFIHRNVYTCTYKLAFHSSVKLKLSTDKCLISLYPILIPIFSKSAQFCHITVRDLLGYKWFNFNVDKYIASYSI